MTQPLHIGDSHAASLRNRGQYPKAGEAPGQLRAPHGAEPTEISAIAFNTDAVTPEGEEVWINGITPLPDTHHRWLNISGLADAELIANLLTPMGVSALAMEDVLSAHQRPRADEEENHTLIFLTMVRRDQEADLNVYEHLVVFCNDDHVITVQEREGDVFNPIRQRMKRKTARMRKHGAPYLAYALLDAVIDGFFPVLENLSEAIEQAEITVMEDGGDVPLKDVHTIKREVTGLRRLMWPMRDLVYQLIKSAEDESGTFAGLDLAHLQDCRDHVLQLIDQADGVIDTCNDVRDMIIAQSGMKLNEVMGVLTVIATIFMPLGFLAGIWGMNFDASSPYNMPELGLRYGYPIALGLMASVGIGLVIWFKKKGWL